jgi:hypothetical protein
MFGFFVKYYKLLIFFERSKRKDWSSNKNRPERLVVVPALELGSN